MIEAGPLSASTRLDNLRRGLLAHNLRLLCRGEVGECGRLHALIETLLAFGDCPPDTGTEKREERAGTYYELAVRWLGSLGIDAAAMEEAGQRRKGEGAK